MTHHWHIDPPTSTASRGSADSEQAAWLAAFGAAEDIVRAGGNAPFVLTVDDESVNITPGSTIERTLALLTSLRDDLRLDIR